MISIITTIFNRFEYLTTCLDSVLAQVGIEFEYLIFDDGSTDPRVRSLLENYAAKDRRIRLILSSKNLGLAAALKRAIELSRGEAFIWIDSDDQFSYPGTVRDLSQLLDADQSCCLAYGDYFVIDERGRTLGVGDRCRIQYNPRRLLIDLMVFHPRLLRRSDYINVGGIDDSYSCAFDYDLVLKLSELKGRKIVHYPRAGYLYRWHRSNISILHHNRQVAESQRAINQALKRRGMDQEYRLQVSDGGSKFSLISIK